MAVVARSGLTPVVDRLETEQYSAQLDTMNHLIGCAERHNEPDVAQSITQTMDNYTQLTEAVAA